MHTVSVVATLPVRSVASYPYLISSVKAKTPAPVAAVAAAVSNVVLVFAGLGGLLEYPDELDPYRFEKEL